MNHFRQGDVLVRDIAAIPADSTPVTNEQRIVLAYGEVTGHAHAIDPDQAQEFSFAEAGGVVRRFLQVFEVAELKHEEHATIPLPSGFYEIIQQREFTPEAIRNVAD